MIMNKKILLSIVMILIATVSFAQSGAIMKLDKNTHDFGDFSEDSPKVTCEFTFTNTGDAPLVIFQAVTSCGCTVPQYPTEPILPGKKGTIKIVYDGTGKLPGKFKKSITLRTNSKPEMVRLFITGNMEMSTKKAQN